MSLIQQEILEGRVIQSIEDALTPDWDEIQIEKESLLFEDMGADSLDAIMILMSLEEEFGFDIPEGFLQEWKSVQDIIDYITKKMEERE